MRREEEEIERWKDRGKGKTETARQRDVSCLEDFDHVIICVHAEVREGRIWFVYVSDRERVVNMLKLIMHLIASVVQLKRDTWDRHQQS